MKFFDVRSSVEIPDLPAETFDRKLMGAFLRYGIYADRPASGEKIIFSTFWFQFVSIKYHRFIFRGVSSGEIEFFNRGTDLVVRYRLVLIPMRLVTLALTRNGEAVLIRQYRHGVCEVLWEFPGGAVDAGKDPLDGARRELLEETGYRAADLIQVGHLYPNPALQTNTLYCFLALNVDELIEMAKRGEILHALQAAMLFQALLYLNRIR